MNKTAILNLKKKNNLNRSYNYIYQYILILLLIVFLFNSCVRQDFFATEGSILNISAENTWVKEGARFEVKVEGYDVDGKALWTGTKVYINVENGELEQSSIELTNGKGSFFVKSIASSPIKIYASSGTIQASPYPLEIVVGNNLKVDDFVVIANPANLPVNGGRSEITVTALDENHFPVSDVDVFFSTDKGVLDSAGNSVKTNKDGIAIDYIETNENAVITVKIAHLTKTIDINVTNINSFILIADPPTLPVNGGRSELTVTVYDTNNAPVPNVDVFFSSDYGDLRSGGNAIQTDSYGIARDYLTTVQNTVVTVKVAHLSKTLTVNVADVNSFIINANPSTLPANGGRSEITVTVFDKNNFPVSDVDVYFSTNKGMMDSGGSSIKTNSDGVAIDYLETEENATVTAVVAHLTKTINISVSELTPPNAVISYSPKPVYFGQVVYFNASDSSTTNGDITRCEWNFGDGTTGTGTTIPHIFNESNASITSRTYTVTLIVTDESGLTDSVEVTISVTRSP